MGQTDSHLRESPSGKGSWASQWSWTCSHAEVRDQPLRRQWEALVPAVCPWGYRDAVRLAQCSHDTTSLWRSGLRKDTASAARTQWTSESVWPEKGAQKCEIRSRPQFKRLFRDAGRADGSSGAVEAGAAWPSVWVAQSPTREPPSLRALNVELQRQNSRLSLLRTWDCFSFFTVSMGFQNACI